FIVVLVPIVFVTVRRAFRSPYKLALIGIFYIVPAYYVVLSLNRYIGGGGSTYQEAVSRHDLTIKIFMSDLLFNVKTTAEYWRWGYQMPPASAHSMHLLGVAAA